MTDCPCAEKAIDATWFFCYFQKSYREEMHMKYEGSVARVTAILGASPISFDDAVNVGFKRASKTLRGITGIKVSDHRCKVEDGKIVEYRVTLKVIFVLET